jgi:hypothetical protein
MQDSEAASLTVSMLAEREQQNWNNIPKPIPQDHLDSGAATTAQSKLCELDSLDLTSMVRGQGQSEIRGSERRRRRHSPAPRCSSERHGRAVPARPIRSCPRSSSPNTHREHQVTALPPASTAQLQHQRMHSKQRREEAGSSTGPEAIGGGGSRRETQPDLLGGEGSVNSNWRCWVRRWRQSSCPSVGGKGRRNRPERPDDGGEDLDRQRARG